MWQIKMCEEKERNEMMKWIKRVFSMAVKWSVANAIEASSELLLFLWKPQNAVPAYHLWKIAITLSYALKCDEILTNARQAMDIPFDKS